MKKGAHNTGRYMNSQFSTAKLQVSIERMVIWPQREPRIKSLLWTQDSPSQMSVPRAGRPFFLLMWLIQRVLLCISHQLSWCPFRFCLPLLSLLPGYDCYDSFSRTLPRLIASIISINDWRINALHSFRALNDWNGTPRLRQLANTIMERNYCSYD